MEREGRIKNKERGRKRRKKEEKRGSKIYREKCKNEMTRKRKWLT